MPPSKPARQTAGSTLPRTIGALDWRRRAGTPRGPFHADQAEVRAYRAQAGQQAAGAAARVENDAMNLRQCLQQACVQGAVHHMRSSAASIRAYSAGSMSTL